MDWNSLLGACLGPTLQTLTWLAWLTPVFAILVYLTPCNPGSYWWKDPRAVVADFFYWFVTPLFLGFVQVRMLALGMVLLYGTSEPHFLPVKDLPRWAQWLAILLIQDVLLYWIHRAFHTNWAWAFHAVHHSPKVLDWTASARFHPVNEMLAFVLANVSVLLLGFPQQALADLVPFNVVYSAMVHANLNWTFGPLRYLLASPVFHRWHHTSPAEGGNRNFASTFPVLDVLFGTFYMPPGKLPEVYGTSEPDFPQGFLGQFLHPFRAIPGQVGGWLVWAYHRPVSACLAGLAGGLACALVLGGLYWRASQIERDEQLALVQHHADEAGTSSPIPSVTPVLGVALSADMRWLVSANDDGTLKVWDAVSGQEKATLTGHSHMVRSVAISADGGRIVSGSYDRTVRVWEGFKEKCVLRGHKGFVLAVGVSADGGRIVSSSADGAVKVWDGNSGEEIATLTRDSGAVPAVAVSPDGSRVVTASWGTARLWDVQTGRELCCLDGHTNLVYSVALSADGSTVATGGFDALVKVWDAHTGKERLSLSGHSGPVYSVAVSPDGRRVISGSKDATLKVWDTGSGEVKTTLAGHADAIMGVALSSDGLHAVSGSQDGSVRGWNLPPYEGPRQTAARARE